jgi:hypothetical protein
MLSQNLFQAAATSHLEQLHLGADDLVIAPSQFSDDISSWVPLISPAKVLYTPDGENILSAADTRTEQTFRQALYLRLTGMNLENLEAATRQDSSLVQISRLVQQGDRMYLASPLARDAVAVRQTVRERLEPFFSAADMLPAIRTRLEGYKRVIVIDSETRPSFDDAALAKWFVVDKALDGDGLKIRICHQDITSF